MSSIFIKMKYWILIWRKKGRGPEVGRWRANPSCHSPRKRGAIHLPIQECYRPLSMHARKKFQNQLSEIYRNKWQATWILRTVSNSGGVTWPTVINCMPYGVPCRHKALHKLPNNFIVFQFFSFFKIYIQCCTDWIKRGAIIGNGW